MVAVASDNKQYVQLENPNGALAPVVVDDDISTKDIYIRIYNGGSNDANTLLKNELYFPFAAYKDVGNNGLSSDDIYIPAGTWYCTDGSYERFYPAGAEKDGIYTLKAKSTASGIGSSTAYAEAKLQISGRMYDFRITNISGENWKTYFDNGGIFTSGRSDRFGNYFYAESQCIPVIRGPNKEAVMPGNRVTFNVKTYGAYTSGEKVVGYLSFRGEDDSLLELIYYEKNAQEKQAIKRFESRLEAAAISSIRAGEVTWAGCFAYPAEAMFVRAGTNINNLTELRAGLYSGQVFVNVDLCLEDAKGRRILSYENRNNSQNGYCNMWQLEHALTKKTDDRGVVFDLKYGDFIILEANPVKSIKYAINIIF